MSKTLPKDGLAGLKAHFNQDLTAGFLVFLIALPLCLGISMASGFPPFAGIITAMVGGLLVSPLMGPRLSIKGPAAGLISIAVAAVAELGQGDAAAGYRYALAVVVITGLVQVAFALLKLGRYVDFFPTSAVHGMLAAIGIIIIAKQLPVLLGSTPEGKTPIALLMELPQLVRRADAHAFWGELALMPWLVGGVGLATALVATAIARVQSSVKAQIAYASAAQIGLIFIEIALGWNVLALVHISGNALLRTYQLLISPSIVTYQIREQLFGFDPNRRSYEHRLPNRVRSSLYVLAVTEFGLDALMYRTLWNPLKAAGRKLDFLTVTGAMALFGPVIMVFVVVLLRPEWIPPALKPIMPYVAASIALVSVLKAFAELRHARLAWFLLVMNHSFVALAVAFNSRLDVPSTLLYLGGIYLAAFVGVVALQRLRRLEGGIDLSRFHGHYYEHPRLSFAVLLACLAISGFPITTAFLGEDLLFAHIGQEQLGLAVLFSLSFVLDGLAAVRIFARIFLGPHAKTYHEVAYRSS